MYEYDYRRSFGLNIGFIELLYTKHVNTNNYSATANHHILQITTAPSKTFPACYVFSSHSLVTASNIGDFSASTLKSSLHSLPYRTDLVAPVFFLITPRHGPHRQHRSFSYANRFRGNVLTELFPSNGRLFLIRICCLATVVVPLSLLRPLPRNECCFRAVR
jgi:hypothetical protein